MSFSVTPASYLVAMTSLLERPPGADDWLPMFSEDPVDRLVDRRRVAASIEAECTALVAEMVRRGAHDDLGYRSMVSLLTDRLGISAGAARMIGVATALDDMPHTQAALARGALDLPRVRRLVAARESNPILFDKHEQALVDTIEGLAMGDVGRVLDYWSQQADLEAVERDTAAIQERRRLFVSVLNGMVHVDGRLDLVAGQVLITALNSITDSANLDPDNDRTPAQRRARCPGRPVSRLSRPRCPSGAAHRAAPCDRPPVVGRPWRLRRAAM